MISKLFAKAYSVTQWRKSNYNKGIMADLYAIPSGEYLVSSTRYYVSTIYLLTTLETSHFKYTKYFFYSVNLLIAEYSDGPLRSLPIITPLSSTR